MNGVQSALEQNPSENKDSYRESDLPCPSHLWMPPNQRQRKRPHTTDCKDNKGFFKIPLNRFLCIVWRVGDLQKFITMFTLYGFILNFFSAEGALFHYHLSTKNVTLQRARLYGPCGKRSITIQGPLFYKTSQYAVTDDTLPCNIKKPVPCRPANSSPCRAHK